MKLLNNYEPCTREIPTGSADDEIRLVGRYHAQTLSRIIVGILLTVFALLTVLSGYRIAPPIYILGMLFLLPLPLEQLLLPHVPRRSVVLPFLRKHYHYNSLRYAARSITSVLVCLLLLIWQKHMGLCRAGFAWMEYTPLFLTGIILFSRMFAPQLLAHRIKHNLLSGKY